MIEFGYALKKFISFFLEPLSVVFMLVLIALVFALFKRQKTISWLLSVALIWFFIASYQPVGEFLVRPLEVSQKVFQVTPTPIDYIIVLGGGGKTSDQSVPLALRLRPTGLQRFHEGLRLLKAYPHSKIIFCGPFSSKKMLPESLVYKKLALQLGINSKRILTVTTAKDTAQEAKEVKKIVGSHSSILITKASHMPRALRFFETQGLTPLSAPVSFAHAGVYRWDRIFSLAALHKTHIALHEYLGRVWQYLIIK